MQIYDSIQQHMEISHMFGTFTLVSLHFLGSPVSVLRECILIYVFTCTVVIKEAVVFEIACRKGVPKASFSSSKSEIAGVKQVTMLFRRITDMVRGWDMLG